MRKHNVFGCTFLSTDDGFLIDAKGQPTQYVTNDLTVFMDRERGRKLFEGREIRDDDHCAFTGEYVNGAGSTEYHYVLLIRDGRLHEVKDIFPYGVMWD